MESNQRELPPNPRETANIWSIIFFGWTIPLFKKGYATVLQLNDVFRPLNCDKSQSLGDRLESNWKKRLMKSKRCSLLIVIIDTFWRDYAFLAILCFFNEIVLRLGQQLLLGHLLMYFRTVSNIKYQNALIYAIGIVTLNFLNALIGNHIMFRSLHYGMKIRIAVCSLIYRKALRLSQTALGETASGKVTNLLSNDVNRFDQASYFINSLWISPLLTLIVGCLLWNEVGIAGIVGIVVILTIVPVLSYAAKLTLKFRMKTALRTDERVRFMDEIISGVQVIKMYAWEKPFASLVDYARKLELRALRKTAYIRGFHMTFLLFTTRLALFCTMVTIILIYGPERITASQIFVITSYFGVIAHMMSQRFTRGISECAEVQVALKRLEKFLHLEEKTSFPRENGHFDEEDGGNINFAMDNFSEVNDLVHSRQENSEKKVNSSDRIISLKNVRARWTMPSTENISKKSDKKRNTKNTDKRNESNGNGHSMDSNYNQTSENRNMKQGTDLQSQTSTLNGLSAEISNGKLIGIVGPVGAGKSSLLQVLLRELPIESGSISINGSISYASQEPWVFAASVRQNILFGEEYDRDRYNEVVLACDLAKDFRQFENSDQTIVGERGASLSGGQKARINLARACYRNTDFYLLDDPLSAVDAHVGTHIFKKCIGPKGLLGKRQTTRVLVTHQVHFLKEADWIVVLKEGKIEAEGKPIELIRNGVNLDKLGLSPLEENSDLNNESISRTSSIRSVSTNIDDHAEVQSEGEIGNSKKDEGIPLEASSKGKVKGSLTLNYFRAGDHWSVLLILLFSFLFVQFIASAADYWVSVWTKQEEKRTSDKYQKIMTVNGTHHQLLNANDSSMLSTSTCIIVQGIFVAALFIFGIARSIGFYWICSRISQNVHNSMFNGIISTTMHFFDTNPSGRILNRFAKDMGTVDELLPKSMLDATQNVLSMFGLITVTAVVNPLFMIPVVLLGALFLLVQKIYLKTSKNVKRLEGTAKSPAFTHLAATLSGLSTIRAFNVETILMKEFDHHQDMHSACWYMIISTRTVFGLALDIICFVFVSCIIFYYILIDTNVPGEKVGLAITQALSLTGVVQWGMRSCAEVSNQMTAVERVLEYQNLKPESQPKQPQTIAADWPSKGCIEYRNVCYRYFTEAELALRNLSFVVIPMEKIGIVGRTGAGKSSLIGSFFRLACVEGQILIDGIDTADIQLSDLRKQIAIIPQDPVLFSGTLRKNLDPFEEYSDSDIWNALESVELKASISDSLGLESKVLPRGSNYSVGQRQLLCLARAILRKNRILLMDEATANVDPQTDSLIQQTIRRKFIECTVLTVAHRLHTVIDSDRVIVMSFGSAIEFDKPHNLLQNENGIFHSMVKAMGEQEFDRLSQIAANKFKSSKDFTQ